MCMYVCMYESIQHKTRNCPVLRKMTMELVCMCAKQVVILKSLLGKSSNTETMMQIVDTVTKCDG